MTKHSLKEFAQRTSSLTASFQLIGPAQKVFWFEQASSNDRARKIALKKLSPFHSFYDCDVRCVAVDFRNTKTLALRPLRIGRAMLGRSSAFERYPSFAPTFRSYGRERSYPTNRYIRIRESFVRCGADGNSWGGLQPAASDPKIAPTPPSSPLPRVLRERDYGSLDKSQYGLFVQFFRQASPYIEGHRGRTFVLAIPGEVVDRKDALHTLLEDVALLHGLGVRLVLVVGARTQINQALRENGKEPRYAGGCRVTDDVAMRAAIAAAGLARMEVESRLSKGPAVTMIRRHARSSVHSVNQSGVYGPGVTTVSGNYVAAKRKGVVGGVDYQHTGVVRFVQANAVRYQLNAGNIVLLSNLGFSAAGEVLNCDTYTVAVKAAVDLKADKLIVATLPEVQPLDLPPWLPLKEAEELLVEMMGGGKGLNNVDCDNAPVQRAQNAFFAVPTGSNGSSSAQEETMSSSVGELDFDRWHEYGLPLPLMAASVSCRAGVKRAHLIDARIDGSLLLELYSRDGVGVMISNDFYEGIRPAVPSDLAGIEELLDPLVQRGVLVQRTPQQLSEELPFFTVLEREQRILACAAMKPLGKGMNGEEIAEIAAFCVHPDYRGSGKGDSLLEYLEQEAHRKGLQRLILLTTRTADWFEQRGFKWAGQAHVSEYLPASRRAKIDPSRNSQLFTKTVGTA